MRLGFLIVEFGAYRLALETAGAMLDANWLLGWLKDQVVSQRPPVQATDAAIWLAERVEAQWPNRAYDVEVRRTDRLASARMVGRPHREPRH